MNGYTIQASIDKLEKAIENGSGSGGASSAAQVSFDNTGTGISAKNVQGAIVELETDINNKGFGVVIVDTNLSSFQAVDDTYTVNFDGLAVIGIIASDASPRLSVNNSDGAFYSFVNAAGASGSLTIPVKTGDVITITNISQCTVTRINKYPLNIPSNTRKKGGSK